MFERFILLPAASLELRHLTAAVGVHWRVWNDAELVMTPHIMRAQLEHNSRFQKGLWLLDNETGRKHLVALVNTARFDLKNINPRRLSVSPKEMVPTNYNTAALSTKEDGNALGCFIISRLWADGILEQFGPKHSGEIGRLLKGAPKLLIQAVKEAAEKDSGIQYLTAISTPTLIEEKMKILPGRPVTFGQVVNYLRNFSCPVLKRFHGRLGAELLKIIPRTPDHFGRPVSNKLSGGAAIALVIYPFRNGADLIKRRDKDAVSIRYLDS